MKPSEKILKRIREECPDLKLPEDVYIASIRTGWAAKAAGAAAWFLSSYNQPSFEVLCFTPMTKILKSKKLVFVKEYLDYQVCFYIYAEEDLKKPLPKVQF